MLDMEKIQAQSSIKTEILGIVKHFLEYPILNNYLNKAETEMKVNTFDFELKLDDIRKNINDKHKLIYNVKR